MASFHGVFNVGTFKTDINFFHLEIYQERDSLGRPASRTKGGTMTIEFNSTEDTVVNEWMINPAMRLDGSVIFLRIDTKAKLREITFENAYCVSMQERSDGTGSSGQMVTTIKVSPEVVQTGTIKLDKRWPKTE